MILTHLEINAMGTNVGSEEVSVTKRTSFGQISLALIRPKTSDAFFQLVFLLGNKRWRRRRSVHASSLSVVVPPFDRRQRPADIELDIMVSCYDYLKSTKCLHYDSVFMDVSNKLRIYGLSIRVINASWVQSDIDEWESLRIPALDGDNVYVTHIFRRESIPSIFQSSATVLHDIKRQRRRFSF